MRKKIALFTHGGLGTGDFSQGFPALTQIINGLAKDFDITVYSLATFNKEFYSNHFRAYCVPGWVKFQRLRWIYLITAFVLHNARTNYHALFSFWGYPTGKVIVIFGKLFNVPSIITILGGETANLPEINYGLLRNKQTKKAVLWTCTQANKLIAVSHYQENILRAHGIQRDIDVIPWGVDKNLFYPVSKTLELPLKILHISNLNEVKDQETLIKAFQIMRNQMPATLQIVGSDFLNGKLHALVKELKLDEHIKFVGPVSYKNLLPYFHWADAFILTSLSEGQNMAITEAMMCGLLPISTKVGIMYDIGSDVGIVAECKDYERLANQAILLYQHPDEWEIKRKAAHKWATQHDFEWTVQKLKGILDNA